VISIVVPVYRNADTLRELHRRLRQVLEAQWLPYEILFVDDACPHGSRTVLSDVAKHDDRVTVVPLERNVGQQLAVLAGLAQATGHCVVVIDADLQDPPEAIPGLLIRLEDGFGAVFAGRRRLHEPFLRKVTSRAFKWVLHLLCGTPPDAGLYVAMNQSMVRRLLSFEVPGPSVVAMIGCAGLPLTSIPVERARRPSGRSAYSSASRLSMGVRSVVWVLSRKWRSHFVLTATDARF
jgi:hypothetical protein